MCWNYKNLRASKKESYGHASWCHHSIRFESILFPRAGKEKYYQPIWQLQKVYHQTSKYWNGGISRKNYHIGQQPASKSCCASHHLQLLLVCCRVHLVMTMQSSLLKDMYWTIISINIAENVYFFWIKSLCFQISKFMLAYARALGVTYYAQNYASIIRQPLTAGDRLL